MPARGGLAVLQPPRDAVGPPVLDKDRAGLLEVESHPVPDALRPGVQHPLVMAGAGAGARLPAAEDVLDLPRGEVGLDLDGAEHRFVADVLVPDGQGQVDGQAVVGHLLISTVQ